MKYTIQCNEGWPLASWDELYTRQEIIEKFMSYASVEWDKMPPKKWFTLGNISEVWNITLKRVKEA